MAESDFDIQLDKTSLVREEVVSDQKSGMIRCLVPINLDGDRDKSRDVIYSGQVQLMTPGGPLPISFEIEASSLEEAIDNYGTAAKKGAEEAMEELKRMQREAASSIVVPGQAPGGKIQIP